MVSPASNTKPWFWVSTLNFMGEWEKQLLETLGEVASRGIKLPKTFPPKQLFLGFEQGAWWKFKVYEVFRQLQPILEVWVDDVYHIQKLWLLSKNHLKGFFGTKSRIATWGWKVCFSKLSCFCRSHAGAQQIKSGENRKYQPLNTKSQIDSSGSLLPADPSKPTRPRCICVVTGRWCRFCCVVWCWQDQLLHVPGASECKLTFIFFLWYIIHTYRCIFEMTHLLTTCM